MKPIDFRNETWEKIQARLTGQRRAVFLAWMNHGPGTTREVSRRSGIDILTFRPRTTEIYQMGGLILLESESSPTPKGGVYAVRTDTSWRAWVTLQRGGAISGQLQLV